MSETRKGIVKINTRRVIIQSGPNVENSVEKNLLMMKTEILKSWTKLASDDVSKHKKKRSDNMNNESDAWQYKKQFVLTIILRISTNKLI